MSGAGGGAKAWVAAALALAAAADQLQAAKACAAEAHLATFDEHAAEDELVAQPHAQAHLALAREEHAAALAAYRALKRRVPMADDALRDGLLLGYYRHLPNPTPEQKSRLAELERQAAERKAVKAEGSRG